MSAYAALANNNASSVGSAGAESPLPAAVSKSRQQIYNNAVAAATAAVEAAAAAASSSVTSYNEKKNLYNAAIKALQAVTDFEQSYVMPLGFKGDKISRGSAGFGYLLKRNTTNNTKKASKTYANFAYGFPTKYYRVFGANTSRVQGEVDKLLAQLELITDSREKRDSAKVEMAEKERLRVAAEKARKALEEQQKMNLFLAQRAQRRSGVAFVGSQTNLARRQENAAMAEQIRIDKLLKNAAAEVNREYTQEELNFLENYNIFKKFSDIPPETQKRLLNAAKATVSVKRGPRTLGKTAGRYFNIASYRLGRGSKPENKFKAAYMGSPANRGATRKLAQPAAPKAANAPKVANARPGFFSGLLSRFGTRKNPSPNRAPLLASALANASA
jgi:hypothetical protein